MEPVFYIAATAIVVAVIDAIIMRRYEARLRRQLRAKDEIIAGQKGLVEELVRQRETLREQCRSLEAKLVRPAGEPLSRAMQSVHAEILQGIADSFTKLREEQRNKEQQRTDSGAEVDVERFRGL